MKPQRQKRKVGGRTTAFVVLCAVSVIGAAFLLHRGAQPQGKESGAEESRVKNEDGVRSADGKKMRAPGDTARVLREAREQILGVANATNQDGEASRILRQTTEYFSSLPMRAATSAIIAELDSGADTSTGLPFRPGEEGLESAPTWRVHLLDLLGSIDPKAAADYARRKIFAAFASADEWAVAMRSIIAAAPAAARGQAGAELSALLTRMLHHAAWRNEPSGGMLESLDFIALTPEPTAHLAQAGKWAAEKNAPALDAALQLALERAVTREGDRVLTSLATEQETFLSSALMRATRASAMARADLRRPNQVSALRAYLTELPADAEEVSVFFAMFPNHRLGVVPGLAGQPILPAADEMRSADLAALATITAWQSDPALAAHALSFMELRDKLQRMLEP